MLSADEAVQKILDHTAPIGRTEDVPLEEAVERCLAEDLIARVDLPPFDNSAMDGYAVHIADVQGASESAPVPLPIQDVLAAGKVSSRVLEAGQAAKIMTGAPIPEGTEAVVMKELTRQTQGHVEILHAPKPGQHIRPRGEDVQKGQSLLAQGRLLRPYEIALLASQGVSRVKVAARPVVAVLATGDELTSLEEPTLAPGRIYNSNGPAILSSLRRWGVQGLDFGIAPDDRPALEALLRKAVEQADALLVSGGVSVGDFDWTGELLEKLGLEVVFWKVAIKPGKPLLFGLLQGKPVFGLPGNPVSALVCLEEFVRPALEKLRGGPASHPSYHLEGRLTADLRKEPGRLHYLFARVSKGAGGFEVQIIRPQGSAMMGMACKANALARVVAEVRHLPKGSSVAFRWLK